MINCPICGRYFDETGFALCECQREPSAPTHCSELRMTGENARSIILNCHALMRGKFRQVPLWSMVGKITGHGSGNSAAICISANLDPHQSAGVKTLRDHIPNTELCRADQREELA